MTLDLLQSSLNELLIPRNELAAIDSREAQAAKDSKTASDLPIDDPKASEMALQIGASRAICQVRRAAVLKILAAKRTALCGNLTAAIDAWAEALNAEQQATLSKITSALTPFFLQDNRALQETVRYFQCPALLQIERARYSLDAWQKSDMEAVLNEVRHFCNHVASHAQTLKIRLK